MSEKIEPALTPEEWATARLEVVGGHGPDGLRLLLPRAPYMSIGQLRGNLGALALLGYFTWEDVDCCLARAHDHEAEYDANGEMAAYEAAMYWHGLATRIAALLPPRQEPTP